VFAPVKRALYRGGALHPAHAL